MANGIAALQCRDDEYTIQRRLWPVWPSTYVALDASGDVVLEAEKSAKGWVDTTTVVPIRDPDGTEIAKLVADGAFDFAGDYSLYDVTASEDRLVAVLEKQFTTRQRAWDVKHPTSGAELCRIQTDTDRSILKRTLNVFPNEYEILRGEDGSTSSEGAVASPNEIGRIRENSGLLARSYSVRFDGVECSVPRDVLVVAAVAFHALDVDGDGVGT